MRVYLDSSSALKRVLDEPESTAVIASVRGRVEADDVLVSSSLAWVEVARALRALATSDATILVDELADTALSGVLERPITPDVVALARRLAPSALRSLDAVHLATALVLDADVVMTHDVRLAGAATHHGVRVESPGAR